MPTFSMRGEKDIGSIDKIGKVVDNSDFAVPLVVFNSLQFQAFSYKEHLREFTLVDILDEENIATLELPRFFKSLYIPHDKFMLLGGLERHFSSSSSRCFYIDERGRLVRLPDMEYGRQYFTTCVDDENSNHERKNYVYAISGFNHEEQHLNQVERFCWEKKTWEQIEPVNTARINASATKCGYKYVYLFGGLSSERNEFTD